MALRFEEYGALFVVGDLLGMLAAISFDDETFFDANKVNNVGADWMLTAKFAGFDLPISQVMPKLALRVRRALA